MAGRRRRGCALALAAGAMLLLAAGAVIIHYGPLSYEVANSVREGDYERLQWLLRVDPFLVNVIDTSDPFEVYAHASLLTMASRYRQKRIVELLLRRGANVNWHGWGLQTALHDLAEYDDGKTIRLLLEHGADPDARAYAETTPLHFAAEAGNQRAAEVLLSHGADVNARDNEGKTPLDYAVAEGHESTAALLRAHGGR